MNKLNRNSHMDFDKLYFWTATIHNWNNLLTQDNRKKIITDSLSHLSKLNLIDVYGFVIMPNHIHLIWKLKSKNGKESPKSSFLKYTAHCYRKLLPLNELIKYKVRAINKQYEFWQRDSLAIELYSPNVIFQKLDYIHLNPMAKNWNLVENPSDYHFSSSAFYEHNHKKFDFLKHIGNEI